MNIDNGKTRNKTEQQSNKAWFERFWKKELIRWSDFINTVKNDYSIRTYKGYNIKGSSYLDSGMGYRNILLSENLQISFNYNSSVQYIEYHYIPNDIIKMAGIYRYVKHTEHYGISILGFNYSEIMPFKSSPETLLDILILKTFSYSSSGHFITHAKALKKLLETLDKDFEMKLSEFEKSCINDLNSVIEKHDNVVDAYLCQISKEG